MEQPQGTEQQTIFEAGPFHNVLRKLRLEHRHGMLALLCILGTWLPLLLLTLYEGSFHDGVSLTFLNDIAVHTRLLLAMPLLILIRPIVNLKTAEVIKYITQELLTPEDQAEMRQGTFPVFRKMASSFWTDFVILLLVVLYAVGLLRGGFFVGMEKGISSWMITGMAENKQLSLAGTWAVIISLPMFQFLLIRWLWRYLVWMILLFKFASKTMLLQPSHADRSGGLGILVLAQRSFNMVFMACSIVISGQLIMKIISDPASFGMIKGVTIGFIVFGLLLILLPLFFFMGKLIRIKQRGLLQYSYLASAMSRRFEQDWLNERPIEKRIEDRQVDPSMGYDYSGMFDNLQQMRAAPVSVRDIAGMAVMLFVPFIPILFIYFSAAELLQKILGLLM